MKQFILTHKLLCIILACVVVVGAACAIVLPIALKHEHTFATEWTSDETNHWHAATCAHTDEKSGLAVHDFNDGEIMTPATEEAAGVKTFTCKTCGFKKTEEIKKLEHTHKFATEWTSDETNHWHAATCEHTDETSGLAAHTFGDWTTKTEAGLDVDKVEKRTCEVCGYVEEKTIQGTATHNYAETWSFDETHHWKESTCEHDPALKTEEGEHVGAWTTLTEASYGVDKVEERTCTVCGKYQTQTIAGTALEAKDNNVDVNEDEIDFTYSGKEQSIADLITANNKEGMIIKYEGTDGTTYEESTTAPKNAGTYQYTITIPSTAEWKEGRATGVFEIKKYKVRCPNKFISTLNKGETTTKKLCEIDLSDDDKIDLDEIALIYSSTNNPNGVGAGRMNVNVASIKVGPEYEANFEIIGLPTGNNATIEWIVKDGTDEFAFKNNGAVDASLNYYQGRILHGSVEVGDKLIVLGISGVKQVKVSCTIAKIEYNKKYTSDYVETTVATKGEDVKITFTKDDASVNLSDVNYIVSAQTIDEINQFRPTTQSDELSFIGNEYRVFKLKVNTANTIQITAKNEYASLTVYDAKTGAEIELTGNELQFAEGTEILIVVKQTTTNATNQITVEIVE